MERDSNKPFDGSVVNDISKRDMHKMRCFPQCGTIYARALSLLITHETNFIAVVCNSRMICMPLKWANVFETVSLTKRRVCAFHSI